MSSVDDCTLCSLNIDVPRNWKAKNDCIIKEDTVANIIELLQRAMDIITGTIPARSGLLNRLKPLTENETVCGNAVKRGAARYVVLSTVNDETCQDLIEDVDNLIVAITEQIRDLINWLDDPLLNPRIGQLEECVRCLNTKLVDVSSKYEDDIGNLEKEFGEMKDCFTLAINAKKYEIEKLEEKYLQKRYQLVYSNVNASNYANALIEFFHINNENILESFVFDLYSTEKIENILMFSYFLPQEHHRATLYQKLFSTMSLNQHLFSLNMLSFYKILKDDIFRQCGSMPVSQCTSISKKTSDTMRQVQATTNVLMATLANKIQVGTFEDIIRTCSPDNSVTLIGRALHDVLPNILRDAYIRSGKKIEKVLPFVSSLRWNNQKLKAFSTLLSLGNPWNETLATAFEMKKAMLTLNGPDGQVEDTEDALKLLKNGLPSVIRCIVWHSTCSFQYSNTYLAVSGGLGGGNTKVEMISSFPQDRAKWTLIPIEIQKHIWQFQAINKQTGEYLSAHLPWKNKGESWGVAAASTNDYGDYVGYQYNWKIIPSSNGEIFALYHVGRNGIMYPNAEILLNGEVSPYWSLTCDE